MERKQHFWSGILFGIGLMVIVDEVIFHQLLQWHHFYDRATSGFGILTDGLLTSFGFFAAVFGLFLFADLRKKMSIYWMSWIGSVCLGAGGFQLFDGLVSHKLLQIHQIRYGVDILPYDLAWNLFAALLLIIGAVMVKKTTFDREDS
ncbi:DUF2243 domain-containing protein [Jeotgalibacillus sp. JSM ZJ347]|uniref:DUF2243 domain-containing protein n=1 Tax=Jeotgalibacillus sp. JSM ZJ347 TaxID=3342117 RepID=UPI0035A87F91